MDVNGPHEICFSIDKPVKTKIPPRLNPPPMLLTDGDSFFQLDQQALARLDRFQKRTLFTLTSPEGVTLFQEITLKLAFEVCTPPTSLCPS